MKLIGMLDSPYVRRVAVTLQLMGLKFEHQSLSVFSTYDQFRAINPVVKAPTLLADDGTVVGVYVNSYRRLSRNTAAPINIEWGYDNRTVGIRSPISSPAARRVENRVIGADANPYVAMAMTLACGYLGLKNKIKPKPERKGDAYLSPYSLPRSLGEALDWLRKESDLHEVLGKEFITVYSEIKELEFDEFMKVISPWEREHLLLHV